MITLHAEYTMTNIPKQQNGTIHIPNPNTEGKTKSAGKKSSLLGITTTGVISVPPTMSIIEGVQMMSRHCFRRLPITDVINIMGGVSRYNLVVNCHK